VDAGVEEQAMAMGRAVSTAEDAAQDAAEAAEDAAEAAELAAGM